MIRQSLAATQINGVRTDGKYIGSARVNLPYFLSILQPFHLLLNDKVAYFHHGNILISLLQIPANV